MGTLTSLLHRTATGPDHLCLAKEFSHTHKYRHRHIQTHYHTSFPDIMTLVYTHFSMWLIFFFFFSSHFFSKKKATRK